MFLLIIGFAEGEQFCNQQSLTLNQTFWTLEIRKFPTMVIILLFYIEFTQINIVNLYLQIFHH